MSANMAKIVKKGAVWSHHGRRRGLLGLSVAKNREARIQRRAPEMYGSMQELMDSRRDRSV